MFSLLFTVLAVRRTHSLSSLMRTHPQYLCDCYVRKLLNMADVASDLGIILCFSKADCTVIRSLLALMLSDN